MQFSEEHISQALRLKYLASGEARSSGTWGEDRVNKSILHISGQQVWSITHTCKSGVVRIEMLFKLFCLCLAAACVLSAPPTDEVPKERQQPTVIPIVSQSEEFDADGKYKFR